MCTQMHAQDYFRNGKGKTAKSKRTGLWHFYYDNGQLSAKGMYKNGLKDGNWEMYYENGQLKLSGIYQNGLVRGNFKEYYPGGEPKEPALESVNVSVEPLPPGGSFDAFKNWVAANYNLPEKAYKAKVDGTVLATFVVEKDGSVDHINIIGDVGYGTGEELERVLMLSEKWKPGIHNGKTVRVKFRIPLKIRTQ
ncbi:energy transducer TonB [Gynurincola endophyticus]|uniref:energy transducer TonB n=1 Tax=Gynurincola endophyticus TaxID=2479004 RepID=UPI00131595AA|nr:energy transducer TonB [Gynurincola endophyticus]